MKLKDDLKRKKGIGDSRKTHTSRNIFDSLITPQKGLKIKKNVTSGRAVEKNIDVSSLSGVEIENIKNELIRDLKDMKRVDEISTELEEFENMDLDQLFPVVNEIKRGVVIEKIAKRKEENYFACLGLLCLLSKMISIDSQRIYDSQSRNKKNYHKYFYRLAIDEYNAEGEEDPMYELVKSAGLTLLFSVVGVYVEKKYGSEAADMIQKVADDFVGGSDKDETQQASSGSPLNDLMNMFMSRQ